MIKLQNIIANSLHNAFSTTALPIMISTMTTLRASLIVGAPFFNLLVPLMILSFFIFYPIGTFYYMRNNIPRILDKSDTNFHAKHNSTYSGLRILETKCHECSLWFILLVLYRRVFYSIVIVMLVNYQAI